MGHLNSFLASGGGNLNKNFPKIQIPGGLPGGGLFKLRFDWYISQVQPYLVQLSHPLLWVSRLQVYDSMKEKQISVDNQTFRRLANLMYCISDMLNLAWFSV